MGEEDKGEREGIYRESSLGTWLSWQLIVVDDEKCGQEFFCQFLVIIFFSD